MSIIDLFFSFKGRIGRLAYFGSTLALIIIGVTSTFALNIISQNLNSNYSSGVIPILIIIGFAIMGVGVWSSLAITIKRLHDRDKSGWWMFMGFFPVIGPILAIIELFFLGGIDNPNKFDTKTSGIKGFFEKTKTD